MLCTDVFTTIGVASNCPSDGRYKSFIRRNGRKIAISGLHGSVFGLFPQVFPQLWKTRRKARPSEPYVSEPADVSLARSNQVVGAM
jgi:hypothetical protein